MQGDFSQQQYIGAYCLLNKIVSPSIKQTSRTSISFLYHKEMTAVVIINHIQPECCIKNRLLTFAAFIIAPAPGKRLAKSYPVAIYAFLIENLMALFG